MTRDTDRQNPDTPAAPDALFDTALALERRRRRAVPDDDFLMARATDDLADRLASVRRPFARVALLHCAGGAARRAILAARPDCAIERFDAVPGGGPVEAFAEGPARFDLAVSLLAMQGVNDLPGYLAQARRLLMPDGLFLGCLLGAGTLSELRDVLLLTEAERTGGAGARVAPFADVRDMGGLLQRAGFALPVADVDAVTVRYASLFALIDDLRRLGLTNVLHGRSRRPLTRGFFARAAELYAERHGGPDGRIRATFSIVWVSGWAPDPSQQKPLRPGSASVSLKDVLAGG